MEQQKLKLIKISIQNHPLFNNDFELSLINDFRVQNNRSDSLTNLFGRIWGNNIISLIGLNSSGKTFSIKFLAAILRFLTIKYESYFDELSNLLYGDDPIRIKIYFYGTDRKLYMDDIVFIKNQKTKNYVIASEKVYIKKANINTTKKDVFNFNKAKLLYDRNNLNKELKTFLSRKQSLFNGVANNYAYLYIDDHYLSDYNTVFFSEENIEIINDLVKMINPSIENIKVKEKNKFALKFKNYKKEIIEDKSIFLDDFLSSGTVKIINLYDNVLRILKHGGILFVDELDSNLDVVITELIINCFNNPNINIKGATLVFSTHNPELLDTLERSDSIYFVKKNPLIYLQRYSQAKIRPDVSKSDVYKSGLLHGTDYKYQDYMKLIKDTQKAINK